MAMSVRTWMKKLERAKQIEARCKEKDMEPYTWVKAILERYRTNFGPVAQR
jgi:hypothetical protein